MSGALAAWTLECKTCSHRWPGDAVVEAIRLHFNVEHDSDSIELELRAVCRCGAAMTFDGSEGTLDRYTCPACGGKGSVRRGRQR